MDKVKREAEKKLYGHENIVWIGKPLRRLNYKIIIIMSMYLLMMYTLVVSARHLYENGQVYVNIFNAMFFLGFLWLLYLIYKNDKELKSETYILTDLRVMIYEKDILKYIVLLEDVKLFKESKNGDGTINIWFDRKFYDTFESYKYIGFRNIKENDKIYELIQYQIAKNKGEI